MLIFRRPGLSPRVRGNRRGNVVKGKGARSIPACAGEPLAKVGPKMLTEVYPRVCGGTARSGRQATIGQGLSPRVRGNPYDQPDYWDFIGSIPACAGEPIGIR